MRHHACGQGLRFNRKGGLLIDRFEWDRQLSFSGGVRVYGAVIAIVCACVLGKLPAEAEYTLELHATVDDLRRSAWLRRFLLQRVRLALARMSEEPAAPPETLVDATMLRARLEVLQQVELVDLEVLAVRIEAPAAPGATAPQSAAPAKEADSVSSPFTTAAAAADHLLSVARGLRPPPRPAAKVVLTVALTLDSSVAGRQQIELDVFAAPSVPAAGGGHVVNLGPLEVALPLWSIAVTRSC